MYLISSFYPDSKSLSLCMQHAACSMQHHADHFLLVATMYFITLYDFTYYFYY